MKRCLEVLKSYFGYDDFRPIQREIIESVLARHDSFVLMPTGGGKSICFQIPALILDGVTVVVSPLISLMKDQVDKLREKGIAAVSINSSYTEEENEFARTLFLQNRIKLLYISPERLIQELPWIIDNQIEISLFAIDEAHCVSDWGNDFRPEYARLSILKDEFSDVPIIALTATADELTRDDIVRRLKLYNPQMFIGSFDRSNLSLEVKYGYSVLEKLYCIVDVIARHAGESGIIYCLARKTTDEVARQLNCFGISAAAYHAGLATEQRNDIQMKFLAGEIKIVVATIAFGMGIDKKDIRFIVHFNLPKSIESFYQEIGRGGRDGCPTETILFYNVNDLMALRHFANVSGQPEVSLKKLKYMQKYAEANSCRRAILLNYFGEESQKHCGNCDVCCQSAMEVDIDKISDLRAEQPAKESCGDMILSVQQNNRKKHQIKEEKELSKEEKGLYEHLRAIRKNLAEERGCSAFIIMTNKTLCAVVEARPTTIEEFRSVYGIGDYKTMNFGKCFINAIKEYNLSKEDSIKE